MLEDLSFDIQSLRQAYADGADVHQVMQEVGRRIELARDNPIWISRLSTHQLEPYLTRLAQSRPEELPLYGIPFAIKDNIDLAGVPTTAACEAFAYEPATSAYVVQQLIDAGAVPIGKTNLDQFATGLVGTRSPFGAVHNAFNPEFISGGSSAGSGTATALGQVSFALGTDTAGSGRVPAAFGNIIGVKPTRGLLSTSGVVPACRTLDCVSIFALTVEDARLVLNHSMGFDPKDPYARSLDLDPSGISRIGIPATDEQVFFGNTEYPPLFAQAAEHFSALGMSIEPVSIRPLIEAAKLLYEGAWVAERYLAARQQIETGAALRPEFEAIMNGAAEVPATTYFEGAYRLAAYRRAADALFSQIDALLLPTVPDHYTIAAVNADPIVLNSNLGYYTNFMNLLDMCGLAVPAGFTGEGLPFGITLVGEAGRDLSLMQAAQAFLARTPRPLGAIGKEMQEPELNLPAPDTIPVAVCGAHLSGMPLNGQLTDIGATLKCAIRSAPHYRLYALPGGPPYRPGLARCEEGAAIEMEVFDVPAQHLGHFLQGIPEPLGLGKVELEDGSWVTGFICEPRAISDATDITSFGGWRAYMQSRSPS